MGTHIMVKDVRCSFPRLYGKEITDEGEHNPGITVVLEAEEHAQVISEIKAGIKLCIAGEPKFKGSPPSGSRLCLRGEGMDSWREEYAYLPGNLLLKSGNPKAPVVLHADMSEAIEAKDPIYSGCRVNIKIELWAQANKHGKRVNSKILAVQFNRDDAPFDSSHVTREQAIDGFESLDGASAGMGPVADDQGFLD